LATRIIDAHAHIGDIFHENKNITFKTNIKKSDYEDPFTACERSDYTIPVFPVTVEDLINAGQHRCWEWTLENLTKELDEHPEVAGTVMLPIWPTQTFEEYFAAAKLEPRIIPFTTCVLDMPEDAMAEKLRQDIARGAKGLKLHPTIQNLALDDPRVDVAMKVFRDADLPVVTHCGANPYYADDNPWSKHTNPAYSDFPEVVAFCHRWSDVKIIVAHCCKSAQELYDAVSDLENIYTDTSLCSAALMREGVEVLGEDKILFGTDVPFGSIRYFIASLDKAFADAPDVLDKVAYSNMANLMNMGDQKI
jgi:predicted TIM-barrel fold metal-dependent hydrolase